jgi:hypothetical protein
MAAMADKKDEAHQLNKQSKDDNGRAHGVRRQQGNGDCEDEPSYE